MSSTDGTTKTEHSVWSLGTLADVGTPDDKDSAGAQFLLGVQDDVNEIDDERFLQAARDGQIAWEFDEDAEAIADSAPSVYTSTLWAQFIDLAAYQEDISDYLDDLPEQLEKIASVV
jgi:hypothetical protein